VRNHPPEFVGESLRLALPKLVRSGVRTGATAAHELGQHPASLHKALRARQIEPSGPGGFALSELVRSQLPGNSAAETSLEAHAELLKHKAMLTRLEVGKANGNLIERDGAVAFMAGLMRSLYAAVHYHVGWPARKGNKLCSWPGWSITQTRLGIGAGNVRYERRNAF